MEIFALIMLTIILLALTHLINWIYRKIWKNNDSEVSLIFIVAGTIYIIAVLTIIKYIVIWGQPIYIK